MQSSAFHRLVVAVVVGVGVSVVNGQTGLSRTKTVDASGNGDYSTIGAALLALPSTSDKWTVLVYPGVYSESVTITRAHTDLVGVDRDNVLIKRVNESDPDGISIVGNGDLDIAVRNLTIQTDDPDINQGRGIVIKKKVTGADPSNITLDSLNLSMLNEFSNAIHALDPCSDVKVTNCVVRAYKFTSHATYGGPITRLKVIGCDILMQDGNLFVWDDALVLGTTSIVDQNFGTYNQNSGPDTSGVKAVNATGVRIEGCILRGRGAGIGFTKVTGAVVTGTQSTGSHWGVLVECGDNLLFTSCVLTADSALGLKTSLPLTHYQGVGVTYDESHTCDPGVIRFLGCDIRGLSNHNDSRHALGVLVEHAPLSASGPVRFESCTISATAGPSGKDARGVQSEEPASVLAMDSSISAKQTDTATNTKKAYGIVVPTRTPTIDQSDAVLLSGGQVSSFDANEKETQQFDIFNDSTTEVRIRTAGTRFSKWRGVVGSSERAEPVTQVVSNITASSDTGILGAVLLIAGDQTISTGFGTIGAYRVLSIKGNGVGTMNQKVYIVGRDFGNSQITDEITLSGASTVNGVKPFKVIDRVIFPGQSTTGQSVSIGTTNLLGLYSPISATADVLQQARKASAATSYTIEATGTINLTYSTINVGTVTTGDSVEFRYLGSD